jgi:hypothetical protein
MVNPIGCGRKPSLLLQGVIEKLETNCGHEFHIPKQDKMSILTCARNI